MGELSLEIVEGPDAGTHLDLTRSVVIGRDPAADLVLDDQQASRRHAQLSPHGEYAVVEDLGSSNGTFVEDSELHAPARIDPGQDLLIGVSVIQLRTAAQVSSQPSAVRPVPGGLRAPEREPTYLPSAGERPAAALAAQPANAGTPDSGIARLEELRDVRVRASARTAPLAVAVLAALVVIVYLAAK